MFRPSCRFPTCLLLIFCAGSIYAPALWAESCDRIPSLAPIASKLRGLELLSPVECLAADPEEFRRRAEAAVKHDLDDSRLSAHAAVLAFLGLIPADYPFEECLVGEFARRAAAFFSPIDNLMVVPTWTQVPDAILVHEIVHVLQAQHFPTQSFGHRGYLFDDENLAAAALLEGDAMYVEKRFEETLPESSRTSMDPDAQLAARTPVCELPEGVSRLAGAVYDYGEFFVETLAREGHGNEVEKAFHLVPKNTSTILFPKLFIATQKEHRAQKVVLPRMLMAQGWGAPVFKARLGEISVRMTLKESLLSQAAVLAATGWQGDGISVFFSKGRSRVVWSTSWATERDALQFQAAWIATWQKRYGVPIHEDVSRLRVDIDESVLELNRSGLQVSIAEDKKLAKKKMAP
jgi:hypothetical protein